MVSTKTIIQNFDRAHSTYSENAQVQTATCQFIARKIDEYVEFPRNKLIRVADFGAGTNANLSQKVISSILIEEAHYCYFELIDICEVKAIELLEWLAFMNRRVEATFKTVQQDALSWSQVKNEPKFDLVVSNAMLHWVDNPDEILKNIIENRLDDNGTLAFSTFGKNNLWQLKKLGLPSLNYIGLDDYNLMLEKLGLEVIYANSWWNTIYFKDVISLLKHFKLTGVNSISSNKSWNKSKLKQFCEDYEQFFDEVEQSYPLTYNPMVIICRKKKV